MSTFSFRLIIHFQFICQAAEVTCNKYSHRVATIKHHFSGRRSFFSAFKTKKSHGRKLHLANQQTVSLSFHSLYYSLCVHFLLIRWTVWCIRLTWHNDADKTVANLPILVTDSNLLGNEVVLRTMAYYTQTLANNLVWIIMPLSV